MEREAPPPPSSPPAPALEEANDVVLANPALVAKEHNYASTPRPGPSRYVPREPVAAGSSSPGPSCLRVPEDEEESSAMEIPPGSLNPTWHDDKDIVKNLLTTIERLESDLKAAKAILAGFQRIFPGEDQQSKVANPDKLVHWSDEAVTEAAHLKFLGGSSLYQHLLAKGFPLPSIRTINRRLQALTVKAGHFKDPFTLLGLKVKDMKPEQREAVLILDEMSLQQMIEWDPSNKVLSGYITMPRKEDPVEDDIDTETDSKTKFLEGNPPLPVYYVPSILVHPWANAAGVVKSCLILWYGTSLDTTLFVFFEG